MHEIIAKLDVQDPVRHCLKACLDCHAICEMCAKHCLSMGGDHAGVRHQVLMRDCADLCQMAADFMIRQSYLQGEVCRACARACEDCGESCERLAEGDTMMSACVEQCRTCAEACRSMVGPVPVG